MSKAVAGTDADERLSRRPRCQGFRDRSVEAPVVGDLEHVDATGEGHERSFLSLRLGVAEQKRALLAPLEQQHDAAVVRLLHVRVGSGPQHADVPRPDPPAHVTDQLHGCRIAERAQPGRIAGSRAPGNPDPARARDPREASCAADVVRVLVGEYDRVEGADACARQRLSQRRRIGPAVHEHRR